MRERSLTAAGRVLSFGELALAAAVVTGHSVFGSGPHPVPVLFVLALLSIRLRQGNWRAIGFVPPRSWGMTLLAAFVTAAVVVLLASFVTGPLAKALGLYASHAGNTVLGDMKGHPWVALRGLAIVWTGAAVLEEVGYRRYALLRAMEAFGDSKTAAVLALAVASLLFGIGHYYQGPAGVLARCCDGAVIGAAYLLCKRNLWVPVIAHGLADTVGIVTLYLGLAH
jgi:uncharacterized protein